MTIPKTAHEQGADLLLELRVGRSGLGDDWLYRYVPHDGWKQIGRYLEVRFVTLARKRNSLIWFRVSIVRNTCHRGTVSDLTHSVDNAYINGLDFDSHGVLQTTW